MGDFCLGGKCQSKLNQAEPQLGLPQRGGSVCLHVSDFHVVKLKCPPTHGINISDECYITLLHVAAAS